MTDYEKLSLAVLSGILHGMMLQLAQASMATPEANLEHQEHVVEWSKRTNGILASVAKAIS